MKTGDITAEMLRERMSYDQETGVFRLRRSRTRWKAGQVAGSLGENGYVSIRVCGVLCLAHRLAWLYVHGEWPVEQIDHRNNDRTDNRLANLRPASVDQNARNNRIGGRNTTGLKGAYRKRGKWRSTITVNGKQVSLGTFSTKEEAHAAYCAAAEKYFGEFARGG
jgi:hypothetical protein